MPTDRCKCGRPKSPYEATCRTCAKLAETTRRLKEELTDRKGNTMTRYTARPNVVDAIQIEAIDGNGRVLPSRAKLRFSDTPAWLVPALCDGQIVPVLPGEQMRVMGVMASPGDWIVRRKDGNLSVFHDSEFNGLFYFSPDDVNRGK